MSADRDLLALAAEAVGHPISDGHFQGQKNLGEWWGWLYIDGSGEPPTDSAYTELWNPLTDDADALRLAVKLWLTIDIGGNVHPDRVEVRSLTGKLTAEPHGNDLAAAVRRAIVRAAANEVREG